jgi:hypothetical protein
LEVYGGEPGMVTRNRQRLRPGKDYQYDVAAKKLTLVFNGATSIAVQGASSLLQSYGAG